MPTVMIAEDDLFMADMLKEVLADNGYDVCGIARTVDKAVELGGRYKPDLAILDIRLADGGLGTDIPARLKGQGRMGVLYASGHACQMGLTKTDGDALLFKPYRSEDVVRALKVVEHIVSADEAARQFPKGFSVLSSSPTIDKAATPMDVGLTEQISRLHRQQAKLARLGTFALGERDLSSLFLEAARASAECLGAPYCAIYRYRPAENDLLVESGLGWREGVIGRVVSRADESSPQGRAFTSRGPVICVDLSEGDMFARPTHHTEHGILSTLDVVIGHDYHPNRLPYGVLELGSPVQHNYDSREIDFMTGVANIIAQAVEADKREAALKFAAERLRDLDEDERTFLGAKNGHLGEKNRLLKRLLDQVSGTAMHRSDHGW
jgi:ActR/RegA family two-component response regulator